MFDRRVPVVLHRVGDGEHVLRVDLDLAVEGQAAGRCVGQRPADGAGVSGPCEAASRRWSRPAGRAGSADPAVHGELGVLGAQRPQQLHRRRVRAVVWRYCLRNRSSSRAPVRLIEPESCGVSTATRGVAASAWARVSTGAAGWPFGARPAACAAAAGLRLRRLACRACPPARGRTARRRSP